jgi:hypothetical protein
LGRKVLSFPNCNFLFKKIIKKENDNIDQLDLEQANHQKVADMLFFSVLAGDGSYVQNLMVPGAIQNIEIRMRIFASRK